MSELERRHGARRRLGDCHGKMHWPERGVYFFFEDGENRGGASNGPRVVRVGTHAVTKTSRTTVWNRLRQHRGNLKPIGGNHRQSVFRRLVGEAMMEKGSVARTPSWGWKGSAPKEVRQFECDLEARVSDYLGKMSLLVLPILDPPGRDSQRCFIERNSIALLSGFVAPTPDLASLNWLGSSSPHSRVTSSGLWNRDYVDMVPSPGFLGVLEQAVCASPASRG